jgi:hypothetical protein
MSPQAAYPRPSSTHDTVIVWVTRLAVGLIIIPGLGALLPAWPDAQLYIGRSSLRDEP